VLGQVAFSAVFGEIGWHKEAPRPSGVRVSEDKGPSDFASASRAIQPSMGGLNSIHEHLLHVRADAG